MEVATEGNRRQESKTLVEWNEEVQKAVICNTLAESYSLREKKKNIPEGGKRVGEGGGSD